MTFKVGDMVRPNKDCLKMNPSWDNVRVKVLSIEAEYRFKGLVLETSAPLILLHEYIFIILYWELDLQLTLEDCM